MSRTSETSKPVDHTVRNTLLATGAIAAGTGAGIAAYKILGRTHRIDPEKILKLTDRHVPLKGTVGGSAKNTGRWAPEDVAAKADPQRKVWTDPAAGDAQRFKFHGEDVENAHYKAASATELGPRLHTPEKDSNTIAGRAAITLGFAPALIAGALLRKYKNMPTMLSEGNLAPELIAGSLGAGAIYSGLKNHEPSETERKVLNGIGLLSAPVGGAVTGGAIGSIAGFAGGISAYPAMMKRSKAFAKKMVSEEGGKMGVDRAGEALAQALSRAGIAPTRTRFALHTSAAGLIPGAVTGAIAGTGLGLSTIANESKQRASIKQREESGTPMLYGKKGREIVNVSDILERGKYKDPDVVDGMLIARPHTYNRGVDSLSNLGMLTLFTPVRGLALPSAAANVVNKLVKYHQRPQYVNDSGLDDVKKIHWSTTGGY